MPFRFFVVLLHSKSKTLMNKSPENIAQLIIAAALTLAGIGLLYLGTLLAPQGEIHESILVAFGEVATFAGAIIGIDYRYRKVKGKKD